MTNIHNSKDIHKKEDRKQTKGEFKMKIFTDASITFNKNKEPIYGNCANQFIAKKIGLWIANKYMHKLKLPTIEELVKILGFLSITPKKFQQNTK